MNIRFHNHIQKVLNTIPPKIEFWNNYSIKKVIIDTKNKITLIDKMRYRLEFSIFWNCDTNNGFEPTIGDIEMIDWTDMKSYKNEEISKFTNIPYEDIKILFNILTEKYSYTPEEIEKCK